MDQYQSTPISLPSNSLFLYNTRFMTLLPSPYAGNFIQAPFSSTPWSESKLYLLESVIPILLGPKYNMPPIPVIASPTHQSLSALILCTTSLFCNWLFQFTGTSLLGGLVLRFALRFALGLDVAVADAVALVIGLSVVVGSICGGL